MKVAYHDNYGEVLKTYRKKAGLTQRAFAGLVGLAVSTYSLYESQKRTPPVATAITIAEYLEIPIDKIFDMESSSSDLQNIVTTTKNTLLGGTEPEQLKPKEIIAIHAFRQLSDEDQDEAIIYMEFLKDCRQRLKDFYDVAKHGSTLGVIDKDGRLIPKSILEADENGDLTIRPIKSIEPDQTD